MYSLIVNIDNRQYKTFHIPQLFLIKAPGKNQAHRNLNIELTRRMEKYLEALLSEFANFQTRNTIKERKEIGTVLMGKIGVKRSSRMKGSP